MTREDANGPSRRFINDLGVALVGSIAAIASAVDRDRIRSGVRHAGLPVLLVYLLVALVTGCGVDQGVADRGGNGEDATAAGESVVEQPSVGETDSPKDTNVVSVFPLHDAPLKTDNGGYYFAGKLVLDEGCLRLEVPPDAYGQIRVEKPSGADEPRRMGLLVWPSGFGSRVEGGRVSIVDADSRIFARVGDHVRLTHATIYYKEASERGLLRGMSGDCDGPFYLVGDEVAVYDPDDEPTALRLSDPEVFFPRRRTGRPTRGLFREALGIGELVLDGPCLRLGAGTTIVWPAGFEPHVEQGVVQVRNWAGRVIAKVGDRIAGGGGFSSAGYGDCPGKTFEIHSIEVLPDVEVYFPTQEGTLSKGSWMKQFVGKLVLQGRCLVIDDAVRVRDRIMAPGDESLLIWPENFTLSMDGDVPGIVDASGRVVARLGDEIQLSAVAVTREEAVEHSGFREISPDCSGGLWFVGEDIVAVADGDEGSAGGESAGEETKSGAMDLRGDATVVATFPQHDAPLGTDNGGRYFAGRLALDNGCLRAETPPDANGPGISILLIWPSGYALNVDDEAVGIVGKKGEIAATVGDHIRLRRATISYPEAQEQGLLRGMSEHCEGPFLLVGDEVTVFDPKTEPAELQLSDPDVISRGGRPLSRPAGPICSRLPRVNSCWTVRAFVSRTARRYSGPPVSNLVSTREWSRSAMGRAA